MIDTRDEHNVLTVILEGMCTQRPEYVLLDETLRRQGSPKGEDNKILARVRTITKGFLRIRAASDLARRTGCSVILREFTSVEYIALALSPHASRCIVLNVNHNLSGGIIRVLLARIVCRIGYRFLLIDGEDCAAEIGVLLSRPLLTCRSQDFLPRGTYAVGAPTDYERELLLLGNGLPESDREMLCCKLRGVGIRAEFGGRRPPGTMHCENWIDLSSREAYVAAMASSRSILFLPRIDDYVWRHSGTIWDALRLGKNLICPDLTVFRRQANQYLGAHFLRPEMSLNDLEKSLLKILNA